MQAEEKVLANSFNNAKTKRKERACVHKPKEKICRLKQLLQSIVA
jgi:hypothetical protein